MIVEVQFYIFQTTNPEMILVIVSLLSSNITWQQKNYDISSVKFKGRWNVVFDPSDDHFKKLERYG